MIENGKIAPRLTASGSMKTASTGLSGEHQPVITGLGIVSPIGIGIDAFWTAARAGTPGLRELTLVDARDLPDSCRTVGEVRDFDFERWRSGDSRPGRFTQFAVAVAKMALEDSGLTEEGLRPERLAVAIGTSLSGAVDVHEPSFTAFLRGEEVEPRIVLECPAHSAASQVAMAAGARGHAATFSSACAAGLDAISWAAERVASGAATAVIAGATDSPLSPHSLAAFFKVGVLSKWRGPRSASSRPFERHRSGLVLAEGAAAVVVEDEAHAQARKATVYARILGSGSSLEGAHLRKVDTSGIAVARSISAALRGADLSGSDIDYISAHGNSMVDYDLAETAGFKRAFGRHVHSIPVSSLKSMCGQALAASGAMQVVAACLAIRDKWISPTINYDEPDPACDLDYVPNVGRAARVRNVLIHAHSMGGSHAALILGALR